ncbi:MAG: rRNA maturation RNase YbeY [Myxococcota bacterium]
MGLTEADLSIVITDDASIRELNETWRGRDEATDVLSFSQLEGEGPGPLGGRRVLGDVVISIETASSQAETAGHSLDEEVQRLLVHGVLHLVGYDHERGDAEARRMQAEERRLLGLLAKSDRGPERLR